MLKLKQPSGIWKCGNMKAKQLMKYKSKMLEDLRTNSNVVPDLVLNG
jgi:hypothetical protein